MPLDAEQYQQIKDHVDTLREGGLDDQAIRARLEAAGVDAESLDRLCPPVYEATAPDAGPAEPQLLRDAVLDLLDLLDPVGLVDLAYSDLHRKNEIMDAARAHILKVRRALHEEGH